MRARLQSPLDSKHSAMALVPQAPCTPASTQKVLRAKEVVRPPEVMGRGSAERTRSIIGIDKHGDTSPLPERPRQTPLAESVDGAARVRELPLSLLHHQPPLRPAALQIRHLLHAALRLLDGRIASPLSPLSPWCGRG